MKKDIELNNVDVNQLIQTLDSCKGAVYLETEEGDCFNLKSKLCQFAGIARILEGAKIADAYIRCENPEDETLLFRLNLYKEVPEKK